MGGLLKRLVFVLKVFVRVVTRFPERSYRCGCCLFGALVGSRVNSSDRVNVQLPNLIGQERMTDKLICVRDL